MKVLLVGNYPPDRQESMQLYAAMLRDGLRARGHEVELLQPPAVLGDRTRSLSAANKWLGYADKFLLFRPQLQRAAARADVVHLCDHSNAMYVPALARRPHVVTCHDVLAIRSAMGHFPQNRVSATGRIFQRLIARGLKQAQVILCVSAKTRDDLRGYLGIDESRLRVVPNALHYPYAPVDATERAGALRAAGVAESDRYFFHIGGNHWYKNRSAAIEIFAALRRLDGYQQTRLVMAGGPLTEELRAVVRKHRLEANIVEVTGAANAQIAALYSGAVATLFPSLEEGFGWPIVEAQACGCPVVIADRAPMNEVAGDAAILVDTAKPADAAGIICDALRGAGALRVAGMRNAERYSSTKMLDACEAIYREVISAVTRK